jgi:ATP-dependent exoDNAse (exonuclease V) beta subunit
MSGETLPDKAARTIALTDMDRSFLVEAGAGSGKTSIMAGRVAVLFARGVEPKNVAAITFTEFAASELRIRIDRFVNDLCTGLIPPDLESAFPKEVPAEQRANLLQAKDALDQLVCATIHGFAQALIKPYPAEAGIDPGAEIIDPAEGELAFAEHYQVWLKEHLSGKGDDDIVAELVLADEAHGLPLIRSIADFLRRNRDARLPVSRAWSSDAGEQFVASAKAFEQEIGRLEFQEDKTHAACQAFIEMAKTLGGFAIGTNRPASRTLIEVAGIPRHLACFTQDAEKRQLKAKGAWENAAAAAGKRRTDGSMAFNACQTRYDACHSAFDTLMAMVAGELLRRVVEAMEGLRLDWTKYKRAAALLDFDDLLYTARDHLAKKEDVRQALAKRFRHVLVDEFQDTDPLQIEILWRLCGEAPTHGNLQPLARVLRAGALFLVGDPKQAIYRFRGADVNAYLGAREAIGGNALLKIVANFRSVEPILAFVNDKFEKPLSSAAGQPGFTALAATCKAEKDVPTVAALDIAVEGDKPRADMLRNAEADRIADLCTHLVGNVRVRERDVKRACRLGDIALLAPVGTDLWRFEEALEQRGIPVSTQAGKGFFRRQEIQDLIAVTRAIADARDTLAFGALLRGPLVGLTEAELLDISEGLPADPDHPDRLQQLTLWTQLDHVNHELTRRVLEILQSLARRARSTTPYMLLAEAVSLLDIRAQLRQRFRASADRALANVDLFLETARTYDVRGLRAFARDMRANWEEQVRQVEGRPDAEEQSVSLITIHASKGLEWPIVIPINMTGTPKSESGLMHDRRSGEFSIPVLDIEPAGYGAIKSWNETELARERVRLWYVAATRARDFLVLPRHAAKLSDKSWARIVDLEVAALPAIDPANLGAEMSPPTAPAENTQTRDLFASEAKRITEAAITIQWHRPSLHEADAPPTESVPVFSDPESVEAAVPVIEIAGSATRGTILHKLMEEVLTGETQDTTAELERRATELLSQLGREPSADPKFGIAPTELAATIVRTLNLPEIAALRPHLAPEYTVFGSAIDGRTEKLISGIADAVARDANDEIEAIIDWKSDVEMNSGKQAKYQTQLGDYRKQTGAKRALLVLMTEGRILNV